MDVVCYQFATFTTSPKKAHVGFVQTRPTFSLVPNVRRPLLAGMAAELLCRGFHEAQKGSVQVIANSSPPAIAESRKNTADAIHWIRARSNWTSIPIEKRLAAWGSPAPPMEVRAEYYCSFSWSCEILGLDEEKVRREGPPFQDVRSFRTQGGLANWRQWRANRGLPDPVYRHRFENGGMGRYIKPAPPRGRVEPAPGTECIPVPHSAVPVIDALIAPTPQSNATRYGVR